MFYPHCHLESRNAHQIIHGRVVILFFDAGRFDKENRAISKCKAAVANTRWDHSGSAQKLLDHYRFYPKKIVGSSTLRRCSTEETFEQTSKRRNAVRNAC